MAAHAGGPWLFSALADGSGSVSCERVLDFWHREGFADAGAILQTLGLDCCATVSLDELCRLVDEQLPCAGGYAAQALLVACKHEVAQLRSWLGELGTERDVLRVFLRNARIHAEQLARDADEQVASAIVNHQADLRRLEQVQAEALATLRGERERELERSECAERARLEELERLHAERRQLRSEIELVRVRCSQLEMELADARVRCAVAKHEACDRDMGDVEPGAFQPSHPVVRPRETPRPSRQALNKTSYNKVECNATASQENGVGVCGNKTGHGDAPTSETLSKKTSDHVHNPKNNDKTCQQGMEQCGAKPTHSEQLSREQFSRVPSERCSEQMRGKCDKLTQESAKKPSSGQVGKLTSAQSDEQNREQFDKPGLKHNVKETKEQYRQVREQTIIEYSKQSNSQASKPVLAPTQEQADEQSSEQLMGIVTELNRRKTTDLFTEQHGKQIPESASKECIHLVPDKQTIELTSARATKPESEESTGETNLLRVTSAIESPTGHSDDGTSEQTRQQSHETFIKKGSENPGERACPQNATAQSSGAPSENNSEETSDRVGECPQKFSSPSSRNSYAEGNCSPGPWGTDAPSLTAGPWAAAALSATLAEAASLLEWLEALALQLLRVCYPQGTLLLRVLWSGLYSHADWLAAPLSRLYRELARARQLLASAWRQHRALSAPDLAAAGGAASSPDRRPAVASDARVAPLSGGPRRSPIR